MIRFVNLISWVVDCVIGGMIYLMYLSSISRSEAADVTWPDVSPSKILRPACTQIRQASPDEGPVVAGRYEEGGGGRRGE